MLLIIVILLAMIVAMMMLQELSKESTLDALGDLIMYGGLACAACWVIAKVIVMI